jgi:hypothetical protein
MPKVYESLLAAEAHLVKGYLESAGIAAMVQSDALGGLLGLVPTQETQSSVWVAEEDYARAVGLVQEFLHGQEPEPGATVWHCPNCGEYLDLQFTDCWNCGFSRLAGDAATDE